MSKRYVIALSGGLDSAVLLADVLKSRAPEDVLCVSFRYGSKHEEREAQAAFSLCEHYKVDQEVVHVKLPADKSSLLNKELPIPEGHYQDRTMKSTVVPCRNLIFASYLAAYAENHNAAAIALGVHSGDHAIYPDCRLEFVTALEKAVKLATEGRVAVYTPFVDWDKKQIVAHGDFLKVPFHLTWTCYNGGNVPCRRCGSCVERAEAFTKNKLTDPV